MRVMVFGTFDDLHPGHEYLLTEAQKRGELFVVVARDVNVQRIKNRAPLQNENVRMKAISDRFPSATVMLGDPENFLWPVQTVKPDFILLGYDQKLPPGVTEADLGVPTERLPGFDPHIHKSSLRRDRIA